MILGKVFFPDNYYYQLFTVAGSVFPDVSSMVMFVVDKAKGRPPLQKQSQVLVHFNDALHSYLLWLFSLWHFPLFLGIYSHLWICHISHCEKKYQETDPGMLWPLPIKLRGLFEYRDDYGKLFDRLNLVTFVMLLIIYSMLWL